MDTFGRGRIAPSEHSPSGHPAGGTVSVIVTAYNQEDYVEQALESALNQSYTDTNVLVFDDASSDSTAEKIRAYLERTAGSARFVHHHVNMGLCATLNEALTLIDTEFVTFISGDDWVEPDFVEKSVACLSGFGDDYGLVYCDSYLVNESGSRRATTLFSGRFAPTGSVFDEVLTGGLELKGVHMLLRRTVFDTAGNYDEKLYYEDYDMWLRITRCYKCAFVPEPLSSHRLLPTSMTTRMVRDQTRFQLDRLRILSKHLGVDPGWDAFILPRIDTWAKLLYQKGRRPSESRADLWRVMRLRPRVRTMAYLFLSSLGVPGSWVTALKRVIRPQSTHNGSTRAPNDFP